MRRLYTMLPLALHWAIAVVATVIAVSAWQSYSVQSRLIALGVDIPLPLRLHTAFGDLVGLAPALLPVLGGALALGFLVAAVLRPRLPMLAAVAYPLAGAAAVGLALAVMAWQMAITPIAGARGDLGFAVLCGAGAVGGFVFSRLRTR